MPIDSKLPQWQQVAAFVKDNGDHATLKELEVFLSSQNRNPSNARPDATMLSVNMNSRVHYFGGREARRTDTGNRYDLLYRKTDGSFVTYNPVDHGVWEIHLAEDGTRSVRLVVEPEVIENQLSNSLQPQEAGDGIFEGSNQFRMESHLRDYLAQNLGLLKEFGTTLSLYAEAGNARGVEYSTDVGPIDILAVGTNGAFYVIELKLGRGPDAAVGQTLRYIAAIKKALAKDKPVYGVIVASSITDKLRYAVSEVRDRIFIMEYELKVTLNRVNVSI